jgi:hypothetical protein
VSGFLNSVWIHFILECSIYNEAREELKRRLVFLHELKIEVLLIITIYKGPLHIINNYNSACVSNSKLQYITLLINSH